MAAAQPAHAYWTRWGWRAPVVVVPPPVPGIRAAALLPGPASAHLGAAALRPLGPLHPGALAVSAAVTPAGAAVRAVLAAGLLALALLA